MSRNLETVQDRRWVTINH